MDHFCSRSRRRGELARSSRMPNPASTQKTGASRISMLSLIAYWSRNSATRGVGMRKRRIVGSCGLGVTKKIDGVPNGGGCGSTDVVATTTGTISKPATATSTPRSMTAPGSCTQRPRRPQTNSKIERFHRAFDEEWAYTCPPTGDAQRTRAYDGFIHFYKHHRAHGARMVNPKPQHPQG